MSQMGYWLQFSSPHHCEVQFATNWTNEQRYYPCEILSTKPSFLCASAAVSNMFISDASWCEFHHTKVKVSYPMSPQLAAITPSDASSSPAICSTNCVMCSTWGFTVAISAAKTQCELYSHIYKPDWLINVSHEAIRSRLIFDSFLVIFMHRSCVTTMTTVLSLSPPECNVVGVCFQFLTLFFFKVNEAFYAGTLGFTSLWVNMNAKTFVSYMDFFFSRFLWLTSRNANHKIETNTITILTFITPTFYTRPPRKKKNASPWKNSNSNRQKVQPYVRWCSPRNYRSHDSLSLVYT